jgi:FkbM family methyltransferase
MIEVDNWVTINGDISLKTAVRRGNGSVAQYQSNEVALAVRHCKQTRVAVDVGAHVGIVSYQLSKIFNTVESFEINPDLYPCLEENIKRQKCTNVNVHHEGLGHANTSVSLTKKSKTFGTHITPQSTGDIAIHPLDDYNLDNVDFIKIDVEGFETSVVQGAFETIRRCRPVILFECKGHGERYGFRDIEPLTILRPLDYVKYEYVDPQHKNMVMGPKKTL